MTQQQTNTTVSMQQIIPGGGPAKTYYSASAGLRIAHNFQNPAFPNDPNQVVSLIIAFQPLATTNLSGRFGQCTTNNPKMIEILEQRRENQKADAGGSDILDSKEFQNAAMSDQAKVVHLQRQVDEQNRLLASIRGSEPDKPEEAVEPGNVNVQDEGVASAIHAPATAPVSPRRYIPVAGRKKIA